MKIEIRSTTPKESDGKWDWRVTVTRDDGTKATELVSGGRVIAESVARRLSNPAKRKPNTTKRKNPRVGKRRSSLLPLTDNIVGDVVQLDAADLTAVLGKRIGRRVTATLYFAKDGTLEKKESTRPFVSAEWIRLEGFARGAIVGAKSR